jgi:hypothetical protein
VEAAGRGTRGAHRKHVLHGRDAGRVQAQRLVERRRALPSRKGKHKQSGDRRAGTREGVGAAAALAACRQRTRLWRLLAGARAERTLNMYAMVVTLDVSQLSGWLNAVASCRVERESINSGDRRAGRREGVGASAAQAACRQRSRLWRRLAGARAERTQNMQCMITTLDVSKLSGWLNADAACRVKRESIKRAATGGPGGGRAWARRRRKQRAGRGPKCGGGWQGTRGAHAKHVLHGRDAGRVPAQRLVERRRVLPSRKGRHKKSGDRRAGRREGVGAAAAQAGCRQRTRL